MGENGSLCLVDELSKDELITGDENTKILTLVCNECVFDIDHDFIIRLKVKYPNLYKLSMSHSSGENVCTSNTDLIRITGCKQGKQNTHIHINNIIII